MSEVILGVSVHVFRSRAGRKPSRVRLSVAVCVVAHPDDDGHFNSLRIRLQFWQRSELAKET